ncbi:MAG: hypothetical protein ACLPQS_15255 [Acidimicrobiales bacterium]
MKRFIAALAIGSVVLSVSGIAMAAGGVPLVDEAYATMAVKAPKAFVPTACTGVGGVPYVTYRGSWRGTETDGSPGSTPYNLTGAFTVSKIVWTINLQTQRGVLHGKAALIGQPAAGGPTSTVYSGAITLITQGLPGESSTSDSPVNARGWINAATFTNGKVNGGSILANVEFGITSVFSATGEFGTSMGFPDYSVATNNQAC